MRTIFRKTRTPKLISLFAGCGGLDLPFHEEGYRVVRANDIDQWACETFKKNFGNIIHKGDICQFDPYNDNKNTKCEEKSLKGPYRSSEWYRIKTLNWKFSSRIFLLGNF